MQPESSKLSKFLSMQGATRGSRVEQCAKITGKAPKSPKNATSTSFNTVHLLPKDLGWNMGCQTCLLPWALSNFGTPLH